MVHVLWLLYETRVSAVLAGMLVTMCVCFFCMECYPKVFLDEIFCKVFEVGGNEAL